MFSIWLLLLFLVSSLLTSSVANAQTIADLSSCALGCLVESVPAVGCSFTNATCQCASTELVQLTTRCMLSNCTMADSLGLAKVTAATCKLPHVSHTGQAFSFTIAAIVVATVFVSLRMLSRGWINKKFGAEDYVVLGALVLLIPAVAIAIMMTKYGFGRHIYDLEDGQLLQILKHFYLAEIIYVVVLGLVKVSLVVFYLRMFPQVWFRNLAFGILGLIVLSTTIIFLLTVFSCKPVQYFWNKDLRGSCMDLNAIAYANAGLSIALDLIIISLPIPILLGMNLNRKRKLSVFAMFAIGSFGCVTSMIRLKSLLVFGNSVDPSYDYLPAFVWTTLELMTTLVCTCLPAVRNLFNHHFPNAFHFLSSAATKTPPPPGTSTAFEDKLPKKSVRLSSRSLKDSRSEEEDRRILGISKDGEWIDLEEGCSAVSIDSSNIGIDRTDTAPVLRVGPET
ncbi:CFEM domain-containing protein [Phlyctema vagabunda]|uniref:CFEM domain-containing protein n=1 Tax=Phlyctema vagabunda TaxID=108571 RepID=A0ABR4PYL0_9HELO